MKTNSRFIALAVLLTLAAASTAAAAGWEVLGRRTVQFRTDQDVITVQPNEGRFTKIKLHVSGNGVEFRDLKIFFANGQVHDVKIASHISRGGETRVIDLPGGKRTIKRVRFVYRSSPWNPKKAVVTLWGRR